MNTLSRTEIEQVIRELLQISRRVRPAVRPPPPREKPLPLRISM